MERVIKEAKAKTVMVSGIPPMGCFPGFWTLFPQSDSIGKSRCHKRLNMFMNLWTVEAELRASYLHRDGFRLTPEALENLINALFSKKGFIFPEFKFEEETRAAVTRRHWRSYCLYSVMSIVSSQSD